MKLKTFIYFLFLSFSLNGYSQVFFVSPQGSDTNSGLSVTTPLKTITHALFLINPNSGGTIRLMQGDYYEQVYIENYSNLIIEPEGSGPVTLHGSYEELAGNTYAEGWNWQLVDPNNDLYIKPEYLHNNLIYKTTIPNIDLLNNFIDHNFNWMFRVLEGGETQQIYGYFDLNGYDRFENCDDEAMNAPVQTNGMFFSSRLAEERNGVGYIIRDEDCFDPLNTNKVLYVAVDPADDFLAPNAVDQHYGIHYAKSGAILQMRNCRDSRIDGSANKLITIKHSSRHAVYIDGNMDVRNLYFENLNFEDVRVGITLLAIHPQNIVIRNNSFIHIVDQGYDYPWRDIKANVIESTAIVNTNEYFVLDDEEMNQIDNCIIENNYIKGYFNGIIITKGRNPDQLFPINGFTTVRNNYLEEIGDDALEFEQKNTQIDCHSNFIKNAFRAIATVPNSIGPLYFHENIITATRMADKFDNELLTPDANPIDRYQELHTLKIGGICENETEAANNTDGCLSTNSHFYYNTFAIEGAAVNIPFIPAAQWRNPTESSFFNNIFYSSDGPCTNGTGDNCRNIVLRGNLFYTEKEPSEWTEWLEYRPNINTKYRYWGGSGPGFTDNNLNVVENARAALTCLNTDNQWSNNEEMAIDFVGGVGSCNPSDFFITNNNLEWNLEPLPSHFPPLVHPNRTIPGALEGNSDCDNAFSISANQTDVCTNSYSFSTNAPAPSSQPTCWGGADADDDVWFSFQAASTIHQFNITNASHDMFFALYEENCNELSLVSCDGWDGTQSQNYVNELIIGNFYLLRIYTSAPGVTSDFDLCISTPFVPEDECTTAVSILANNNQTCSNIYNFSTSVTTPSSEPTCWGAADADDDVWFSFQAVSTIHQFNITNASHDMFFALYEENCNELSLVSCDGWDGTQSQNYVNELIIGNFYLLRIYTSASGVTSDFDLCVNVPSLVKDESGASFKKMNINLRKTALRVYPNPSSNQCILDLSELNEPHTIQVFDIKGSILLETSINELTRNYSKELNLKNFPQGLLIIKVQDIQSTYLAKIFHIDD